jgi:hypothetical protein
MRSLVPCDPRIESLYFDPMTLHLLKNVLNPLTLEVLQSEATEGHPVAVLLSPTGEIPQLPGITVYRVSDASSTDNDKSITYSRLIEMIFEADKVFAW